jgi:hypothetical protein
MSGVMFRYDYFVIWANGLNYKDEIIEVLRGEEKLEIVEMKTVQITDMKAFILDLYALDSVPMNHLQAKVEYLHREKPEAVFVFLKHLEPDEYHFKNDWGCFIRSMYIHLLKERIRNTYNPYRKGKRTMENVVHASDHELQVDHTLKLLGHAEGIHYLYGRYGKSMRDDDRDLSYYTPRYE